MVYLQFFSHGLNFLVYFLFVYLDFFEARCHIVHSDLELLIFLPPLSSARIKASALGRFSISQCL